MAKRQNTTESEERSNNKRQSNKRTRMAKRKNSGNERFDRSNSEVAEGRSRSNDISWYTKDATLLSNAANISYANAVGADLDPTGNGSPLWDERLPGITVYSLVPGPGVAKSGISAANVAAENIYSYIRQANSGGKNYDPNDLMSYLLSVDEAYMLYFDAVRVLGAINLYNNENRYAPKAIVEALGWDYDDIIANLANFRYYVNAYATKLNALPVPAKWPYYQRHVWLYSGIYADGTSPKAQLYAYAPVITRVRDDATGNLLVYDLFGTAVDKTAIISPAVRLTKKRTVNDFFKITNLVFGALINSQDIGTIGGDIKKAFGEAGLIHTPSVPDGYAIIPTYNEEVLSQFQNATLSDGLTNCDILMDNSLNAGDVVYAPLAIMAQQNIKAADDKVQHGALASVLPYVGSQMVNMNLNDPKPGDTMVASRLMFAAGGSTFVRSTDGPSPVWEVVQDGTTEIASTDRVAIEILTAGSEIVCGATVYCFEDILGELKLSIFPVVSWYNTNVSTVLTYLASTVIKLSKFRFHPRVLIGAVNWNTDGSLQEVDGQGSFFEVDNYAFISTGTLDNMHSVALLSMFDVPIK